MTRPFRLAIIAGEASGDALGERFVLNLRERLEGRELELVGVGGERLLALGMRPFFPQSDIAVMGFGPVLANLATLLRRMRDAAGGVVAASPDLLLTIDSPDFSLRVAKRVRARAPSIPIVHWVCPSVWAWRQGRARRMKPHVDRILALLPFEPAALARLGGPETIYVGHPLIERLSEYRPTAADAARRADADRPVVAILPGSRRSEVRHLMPVFGQAAARIAQAKPHARFVLPAVAHVEEAVRAEAASWSVRPEIVLGEAEKLATFRSARAALAASGTVTLELAMSGVPMVAAYRGAAWEAALARRLVKLPSVILPNLVLGRNLVPEFIQDSATAEALGDQVLRLLPHGPERTAQLAGFAQVEIEMKRAGTSPAANAVAGALEVAARR